MHIVTSHTSERHIAVDHVVLSLVGDIDELMLNNASEAYSYC